MLKIGVAVGRGGAGRAVVRGTGVRVGGEDTGAWTVTFAGERGVGDVGVGVVGGGSVGVAGVGVVGGRGVGVSPEGKGTTASAVTEGCAVLVDVSGNTTGVAMSGVATGGAPVGDTRAMEAPLVPGSIVTFAVMFQRNRSSLRSGCTTTV